MLRSGSAPILFFPFTSPFRSRDLSYHMIYHLTGHLTFLSHDRLIVLTGSLFIAIVRLIRGRLLFYLLLFPLLHCSRLIVLDPIVLQNPLFVSLGRLVR